MKENIINWIKVIIWISTMSVGVCTLFGVVWIKFGLPTTWWSALLVGTLSGMAVFLYVKWVVEG